MTTVPPRGLIPADRTTWTWVLVGVIGWIGLIAVALQLAAVNPAQVGFDLDLLIQGGRAVAAGRSPYDPALIAGSAPLATGLFYSYPPPVAQAMALVAWLPARVILLAWDGLAIVSLLVVAEAFRRRLSPGRRVRDVLLPVVATIPLVMPLSVGLLFGNLDVWFPAMYGLMALAVVAPSRTTAVAAGLALAIAAFKLHPASLVVWFVVRAWLEQRTGQRGSSVPVVLVALGALSVVGIVSLVIGGTGPWADYLGVVRAGTNASIVDPRNLGIAAQIVGFVGGGDPLARTLHVVVGMVALALTVVAAWRVRDPLTSLAVVAAASLGTLPVTWYHYASAMIPFALLALLRTDGAGRRAVRWSVMGGAIAAVFALSWSPLLWLAIGLIVIAVAETARPAASSSSAPGG